MSIQSSAKAPSLHLSGKNSHTKMAAFSGGLQFMFVAVADHETSERGVWCHHFITIFTGQGGGMVPLTLRIR